MNLRKMLPAALLLLAACTTSSATATETESVGMDPAKTKAASCCDKSATKECTPEQKAACEASKECAKPAETEPAKP
jgi:hypothetical protein